MYRKDINLKLLTSMLKEKYKLELKENLKTQKDKNGFLRIDYKTLTNI